MSKELSIDMLSSMLSWEGTGFFAGVGSRDTPEEIGEVMQTLSRRLREKGYVLRSGELVTRRTGLIEFQSGGIVRLTLLQRSLFRGWATMGSPVIVYSLECILILESSATNMLRVFIQSGRLALWELSDFLEGMC
jgi:hypothetical protein